MMLAHHYTACFYWKIAIRRGYRPSAADSVVMCKHPYIAINLFCPYLFTSFFFGRKKDGETFTTASQLILMFCRNFASMEKCTIALQPVSTPSQYLAVCYVCLFVVIGNTSLTGVKPAGVISSVTAHTASQLASQQGSGCGHACGGARAFHVIVAEDGKQNHQRHSSD